MDTLGWHAGHFTLHCIVWEHLQLKTVQVLAANSNCNSIKLLKTRRVWWGICGSLGSSYHGKCRPPYQWKIQATLPWEIGVGKSGLPYHMKNLVTFSWEVNEALNTRSWTPMLTMILNNVHVCTVPGPEITCWTLCLSSGLPDTPGMILSDPLCNRHMDEIKIYSSWEGSKGRKY